MITMDDINNRLNDKSNQCHVDCNNVLTFKGVVEQYSDLPIANQDSCAKPGDLYIVKCKKDKKNECDDDEYVSKLYIYTGCEYEEIESDNNCVYENPLVNEIIEKQEDVYDEI